MSKKITTAQVLVFLISIALVSHTTHAQICQGLVDIVIAIDDSDSTQRPDGAGGSTLAPGEKSLAQYAIDNMALDSQSGAMLALIAHSSTGRLLQTFTTDKSSLEASLNFEAENQGSNTGSGLQTAIDLHIDSGRDDADKVIIFLLDSGTSDIFSTTTQANRARENGIRVFPVAFGNGSPASIANVELSLLGTNPAAFFRVNSDLDLLDIADAIFTRACPFDAPTTAQTAANTVQAGRNSLSEACQGFADIVIAIDDSTSTQRPAPGGGVEVAPGQFDLAEYYIQNSLLNVDNINIALIAHSSSGRVLSGFSNDSVALNASLTFTPQYQASNTAAGLSTSTDLHLQTGRSGAARFTILLLDAGTSNPFGTFGQAARARNNGVYVLPLAFSSLVSNLELGLLGANGGAYIRANSDADLLGLVDEITSVVCPGALATVAPTTTTTPATTTTTTPATTTTAVPATTTEPTTQSLVSTSAATVATTTSGPAACQGFADIVIAIDDSSSTQRPTSGGGTEVAPGQFDLAEYYIQNSLLNVDNINIAIIAHSSSGRVLSGFSNDSTALNASLTFTPQYANSNTATGLSASTDLHVQTGRSGAERFTILLVDAGTTNLFATFGQAARARNNGVYVMPVAFGNNGAPPISTFELGQLGSNTGAFLTVTSDADLISLVTSITAVVCPGPLPTTSPPSTVSTTTSSTTSTASVTTTTTIPSTTSTASAISTAAATTTTTAPAVVSSASPAVTSTASTTLVPVSTSTTTATTTTSTPSTTSTATGTATTGAQATATTTPSLPGGSEACQGFADIVIAIDDSTSTQRPAPGGGTEVAPGQFDLAEYYIQNSLLNVDNINIALIAHSSSGRVLWGFSNDSTALNASLTFTPQYANSNTATGLSTSTDLHVQTGRSGAERFTILLLDSGTSNPFATFGQAARARNEGVYVMPVAFGNNGAPPVSNLELGLLGANNAAFLTVTSDADLITLVTSISAVVCPGAITTVAPTTTPTVSTSTTTPTVSTSTTTPTVSTSTTTAAPTTTTTITTTATPTTTTSQAATTTTSAAASTSSTTVTVPPTSSTTSSPTTTDTSALTVASTSVSTTTTATTNAAITTTASAGSQACQGFADIVIAIDDSTSTQRPAPGGGTEVAPGQFDLAEYYIQNSLLNVDNINIALIAHSSSGRVLSGFSNDSTALNASLTFTPQYANSNTATGLSTSTDLHVQTGRSGAERFTILLLDSGTSNPFPTFGQAARARNNGVYVMPVAFGNNGAPPVSNLELSLLGANNAAFLTVNNDADLITLITSITAVVCPGPITTVAPTTTTTISTSTLSTTPTTTAAPTTIIITAPPTATTTTTTAPTTTTTATTTPTTTVTMSATSTSASTVSPTTVTVPSTSSTTSSSTTTDTSAVTVSSTSVSTTTSTSPTTTTSSSGSAACQGFADIVIAIDDSTSTQRPAPGGGVEVAPGQFDLAEYYIQNSLLNVDNINIALIAHSSSGRVLSGFSNDSTALNASLTFTPQYSISNTATALSTSTDLHVQTGRSGAERFTILLLDSGTSNPFPTFGQAARARSNGVYVMPVAFGNNGAPPVSNLELSLLGANNAAFLTVNSDADLITLVTSITAVVCPGAITTTSPTTVSTSTAAATTSTTSSPSTASSTATSTTSTPASTSTASPTTSTTAATTSTTAATTSTTAATTSTAAATTSTAAATTSTTAAATSTAAATTSTTAATTSTSSATTTSTSNATTTAGPAACQGFADIVFAIDDSSGAERTGGVVASGEITLARYYVSNSLLDQSNINLAMIAHSTTGRTLSSFSTNTTALNDAIDSLAPEFGTNNLASGLSTSIDLHLNEGRSGASKYVIFLVDARPSNPFPALGQASRARNNGVNVIPIAFGNNGTAAAITDLELSLLAINSNSWLRTDTDEDLINLVGQINALVCPGETITTTAAITTTTAAITTTTAAVTTTTAAITTTTAATTTATSTSTVSTTPVTVAPTTVNTTATTTTTIDPLSVCSTLGVINSIAHVSDPTDVAKFIQCFQNVSEVTSTSVFCKFGTLWNNDLETCSDPVDAPTDPCTNMTEGDVRQYGISCNAYWECVGFFPHSNATCCPSGEAFDGTACVTDANCTDTCPPPPDFVFPQFCPYSESPAGPEYYRVITNTQLIDKACPSGLVFSTDLCYCNGTVTDFCSEDLRLTFENQTIEDYSKNQQILTLYPIAQMFAFPNDTTVNFWGPNYIIAPGFANKEFRKISVVVVFEPTGATSDQVLVHNGPVGDLAGPSVKISISDGASGTLDVSFTLVLVLNSSDVTPIVINVAKGGPIEARLQYDGLDVVATVLKDGAVIGTSTRPAAFVDDTIALRKGAFNIGGGGCLGCNNYVGSMDYIKVFDCVAKVTDLGEAAAVGLQDIITDYDSTIVFPTQAARYFPAATTPSVDDNLAQCEYADFFNGIAHVPYSGDCGKFLQCQLDITFLFNVTIKNCPFGTMWSSGLEACSQPFEAECDPCKGVGDNVRFPYPNYCQAYFQCYRGVSQVRCCADNEIYDESVGCVTDTLNTCNNTCAIAPDPEYFCFITVSTMGEGFYYDLLLQIDRPCPTGLGFNATNCGCTNTISDATPGCEPYVNIGFEWSDVVDYSMNNFTVDWSFISINEHVGDFSDSRANIAVLGTANVEYFGSQVGLAVNFSAPSSLSSNETILYNGRLGSETESIKLSISSVSASTILVSFLLVTEDDTSETTLDVTASSTGYVYATMVYDGLKVTVRAVSDLGTQSAGRAATGYVVRKQGAVNIGSGLCFGVACEPFSGQLTNARLYLCAPTL